MSVFRTVLNSGLRPVEITESTVTMTCQCYTDDDSDSCWFRCGEQATMLWLSPYHDLPMPCCAYHAQACPEGQIVSLARPEGAIGVTFLRQEGRA